MSDNDFQFSEEEYHAADSLFIGSKDNDHLATQDMAFACEHNHQNKTIVLTERFTKMIINEDGFSEKKPHQSTIIIPMHQLELVMLMMMKEAECVMESGNQHD